MKYKGYSDGGLLEKLGRPANENLSSKDYDGKLRSEHLAGIRQERKQRKKYATCLFVFISIYMCTVFVILFFVGFGLMSISDKILITLLSTTLVNVFGLFIYVLKYLFGIAPNRKFEQ